MAETAEEQGIERRARFDIIRYAGCWEDADILLQGLQAREGGAYLSIASAGDNSLSLLSRAPALVLAIDINPVQLACVEIRKAAFKRLTYEELLAFVGVTATDSRLKLYARLADAMPAAAQEFWQRHADLVNGGIIHAGKFEGYFRLFRTFVLPLIHNRRRVRQLLDADSLEAQRQFYDKSWNNLRWRLLFSLFFSRSMMGRLGRDPEFFKYIEGDVASRIFQRAEYALTRIPTRTNPYLEYILTGNFQRALPHYLRRENFEAIRDNLDKLVVFKGNLQEALAREAQRKFDGFNLSDIFEYMSPAQYRSEMEGLLAQAAPGSRLVYWNMLADRKRVDGLEARLKFIDDAADALFKQDKAFFYKALVIAEAT